MFQYTTTRLLGGALKVRGSRRSYVQSRVSPLEGNWQGTNLRHSFDNITLSYTFVTVCVLFDPSGRLSFVVLKGVLSDFACDFTPVSYTKRRSHSPIDTKIPTAVLLYGTDGRKPASSSSCLLILPYTPYTHNRSRPASC